MKLVNALIDEELIEKKNKLDATWRQIIGFGIKYLEEVKTDNYQIREYQRETANLKERIQKATLLIDELSKKNEMLLKEKEGMV